MDQWEDEGFQSASNLTPDSQSEPSMTPDLDPWEAVLTYEASKRRCWERIGWYVTLSLPLNALCLCAFVPCQQLILKPQAVVCRNIGIEIKRLTFQVI